MFHDMPDDMLDDMVCGWPVNGSRHGSSGGGSEYQHLRRALNTNAAQMLLNEPHAFQRVSCDLARKLRMLSNSLFYGGAFSVFWPFWTGLGRFWSFLGLIFPFFAFFDFFATVYSHADPSPDV
jgi:hypothetical protein